MCCSAFEVVYDETLHPAIQDLLKIDGKNFKVSAPDPYTVVINTRKAARRLLDALVPGGLPIMPKHVLEEPYKNGTFASAYNVSTPPDKLVTSGAWRVAQYVHGKRPCSAATRITSAFDQHKQRLPYLNELVIPRSCPTRTPPI